MRRGGSRHNSGGQGGGAGGKPYKGRHSTEEGWCYSSSYQDKASYSGRSSGGDSVGRSNPRGPRKRAVSASDKVVVVNKEKDKVVKNTKDKTSPSLLTPEQ